jgi:arylsulfatase A-like enzyme
MDRVRSCASALILASLALALAACSEGPAPAQGVILLTLDTTRIDALGCYGGSPLVAPHLDQLARESVVYDAAHTVAPLTLPAHASMLTGLYPPRHRVHDNGIATVPASASTLAELAQAAGVQTAAVVSSSVLDRAFALDQGFESWEQPARPEPFQAAAPPEFNAQQVVQRARHWLNRRDKERPFFLWLHFYDPHAPYTPPSAFLQQAGGHPYLAEVAAVDAAIGDLLAPLRVDGSLERMLVLALADHGESLGEHGEPTHGAFCYAATARVPFLARFPGGLRGGERSAAPVSAADVLPTALDALGIDVPAGLDGVSLLRADPPSERGVYIESYSGWLNYGWSPLAGWIEGGEKYLHSSAPELYQLAADPAEADDRFAASDPFVAAARDRIASVWSAPKLELGEQASFAPELLAELRQLGYGATGAPQHDLPPPLEPSDRPAPRERAAELALLQQAAALGQAGRHADVATLLRALLEQNPRHCLALEMLGLHLMELAAFEEALDALQRRLACGPERADTWLNLGLCREKLGQPQEAIEALERALAIDPGHGQVRGELARMLEAAGRRDEASKILRGQAR